jgi:hypothetical protein
VATDAAGNTTSIPRVVIREQGEEIGGPLPIDSSLNAPALDPTQSVSFLDATAFLYTGAGAIQTGVTAGTIQAQSAAVVRGRVLSRGGVPITGVTVSIMGHSEFGSTTTRSKAVRHGCEWVARVGFAERLLPIERQVISLEPVTVVDDVILSQLDAQASIDFRSYRVAAGSVVSDSRGTAGGSDVRAGHRRDIQLLMAAQPMSSVTVRATELRVQQQRNAEHVAGDDAYTYAVELSADEAIAAGATSVTFSKPVAVYVDNFIGFRTGLAMPVGYFDRTLGVWVPSDDGRVIKIVGITAGKADVAVDTTEAAASDSVLTALGFTIAEREELAQRYSVGKSLWRAEVGHFTPFDMNVFNRFEFDPTDPKNRPDRVPDGPDRESCKQSGSIIGCEARTLGEVIDLPGSGGQALHYQSERTRGYTARQRLRWRLLGDTCRPDSIPSSLQ